MAVTVDVRSDLHDRRAAIAPRQWHDVRLGRYAWDFDPHVKIYEANLDGSELKCLTPHATVYTAEGSYSADGTKIVFDNYAADDPGAHQAWNAALAIRVAELLPEAFTPEHLENRK